MILYAHGKHTVDRVHYENTDKLLILQCVMENYVICWDWQLNEFESQISRNPAPCFPDKTHIS